MKVDLAIQHYGVISALGSSVAEIRHHIKVPLPFDLFTLEEQIAVPVARVSITSNETRPVSRAEALALHAIQQVFKESKDFSENKLLMVGCTKGDAQMINRYLPENYLDHRLSSNATNKSISEYYQIPYIPIPSAACATGAQLLAKANLILQQNYQNSILLCMTESSLSKEMIAAFFQLGVLTQDKVGTSPFASSHKGFHMGEGAACLSLFAPTAANTDKYSQIIAVEMGTDAKHFSTFPQGHTYIWKLIQKACKDAGISFAEITHVNLHGTGTAPNDQMEYSLAKEMFLQNRLLTFSAFKHLTGHLLGASGLIEFVLTTLCLENQIPMPIYQFSFTNSSFQSPQYSIQSRDVKYYMTLSYGLGSTIGIIIGKIKKHNG